MARSWAPLLLVSLVAISCQRGLAAEATGDLGRLRSALSLAKSSRSNVIELTPSNFESLLVGPSRPYEVVLLADAEHMRSNGRMKLEHVAAEYGRAAQAHVRALERRLQELKAVESTSTPSPMLPPAVFFARLEFRRDRDLFGRLGIQSLPWLGSVSGDLAVSPASPIVVPQAALKSNDDYPWEAQSLADWAGSLASTGPVEVPRPAGSVIFKLLLAVSVLSLALWVLFRYPLDTYPSLYLAASLVLLWFSFSGGMFVIIRKMPVVYSDPRTHRTVAFLPGQGQLGAEGYLMGSAYLGVGASLAALIKLVPKVRDPANRRIAGYVALASASLALRFVLANHSWKTGLNPRWY